MVALKTLPAAEAIATATLALLMWSLWVATSVDGGDGGAYFWHDARQDLRSLFSFGAGLLLWQLGAATINAGCSPNRWESTRHPTGEATGGVDCRSCVFW
mmetsp:Transcript_49740/g.96083  ORF Transcript_49740/g.96083 Transcript_49740/m.96083 type:complete len:100 (-) Transcript_49740:228-527(-)